MKGGETYKKLLKAGVVFYDDDLPIIEPKVIEEIKKNSSPKKIEVNTKKCPEHQILNPKTNRCVLKTGIIGKAILKELEKEKKPEKEKEIDIKKDRSKCKNKETFMLFMDINEIPEKDFIMLPSGYCFDISEIIEWIKTSGFNNKNPHLITENLFDDSNKKIWEKNPQLLEVLSTYFKKKQEERKNISSIIRHHLDVLYKIGDTGRICYYDNIFSHEVNDSSTFEYSIQSIGELSEMINGLPKDIKKIFNDLRSSSSYITVEKVIKDANEGTTCIHGIGTTLLQIFITNFLILEKYMHDRHHTNFKYEPLRCKMYFIIDKNGNVVIYNAENRLVPNTTIGQNQYYKGVFQQMLSVIKAPTTMIWTMKKLRTNGLTEIFIDKCINNDPSFTTLETLDKWEELEDWRKFILEDKYCFDLLYLIRIITEQLNTTNSTNPYPQYPHNPFTFTFLTMKDLTNLRRRISNNYIIVPDCLLKFLYNSHILWTEDIKKDTEKEWMEKTIELFENELRFKRYFDGFDADRTPIIKGYWVKKYDPGDIDERKILYYLQTMDNTYLNGVKKFVIPDNYYYRAQYEGALIHGYNDKNELK